MFNRICKITFISHGLTVNDSEGIICDSVKAPKLNDYGEDEIRHVCDFLKLRGVSYDMIYSSPYTSCTQSAQIIAKIFHKKPVIIDLKGRNHGDWQGMTYTDLFKEHGIDILAKKPNNGETVKQFNRRVFKIIDELVEANKGNRIIFVTTPEIIQSALAKTLELTPENQHRMLIKTGSLTQISYYKEWSSVIYSDCCPSDF